VDVRRDVQALEIPVSLAQGSHEAPGRAVPAQESFDGLTARTKPVLHFDTAS